MQMFWGKLFGDFTSVFYYNKTENTYIMYDDKKRFEKVVDKFAYLLYYFVYISVWLRG